MTTSTRTRRHMLAVAFVLVLGAAACGGGPDEPVEEDPRGALRDAFDALADYAGYELRVGAEADEAAVAAAVTDGDLDADEAELLASSSFLVRTHGQRTERRIEYVLTVDGDDIAEMRTLIAAYDVYLRVNLEAFVELGDEPEAAASLEEFVEESERLGFGEFGAALQAGGWVQLTGIQQIMSLYEGMLRSMLGSGLEELQAAWGQVAGEMMATFGRLLDDGIDVDYVGSEGAGERVRATIDGDALRLLVVDGVTSFAETELFAGLPEQLVAGFDSGLRELEEAIPADLTVVLDAWISGGRLHQVALDLTQFPDVPDDGEVLVVLGIDEFSGSIEPPGDPVEVDLFRLFGRFMGSMFEADPFDDDGDPFGQPDPFGEPDPFGA